jgi:hypothetical protein
MELFRTALFSDANLLSYYRLEDITDSKGSANLTNVNDVAFNASKFNNGADFGSANTNKQLYNRSLLGTSQAADRTIVGWIKPTVASGEMPFIYFGYAGAKRGYYLKYLSSGNLVGGGFRDYIADYVVNFASGLITDWVHLALTYTGATLEFFVGGVSKGTQNMPVENGIIGSTATDGISLGEFAGSFASGLIDDVAIFDRVLTAAEILTLVEETPTDPGLFDFNG